MKIGFDISPLLWKKKAGIGWYTYNLIKNIEKVDKENIYVLYGSCFRQYKEKYEIKKDFKSENFYIVVKRLPNRIYNYTVQRFLPVEFLYGKFDLIHTLHIFSPLSLYSKQIITIHDLTPLINPNWFLQSDSEKFKFIISKAIKRVEKIIADSYSTKKDIINFFNVNSGKIEVIHLAADEIYRPIENKEAIDYVKKKYGINQKYIFFVGTVEPRKNIPVLIDAFTIIKEKFPEYKLVICGQIGIKSEIFYKKMQEIPENVKKDIILTGYVPVLELPYLYNGCEVFVYPSLYEGFGLPVLEAMSCGVPVITSKTSSLPEVVGDAGILVNPENCEEIVEAILFVLDNENMRKTLSKKGLERAKLFSWENTAKKTLDVYKTLT